MNSLTEMLLRGLGLGSSQGQTYQRPNDGDDDDDGDERDGGNQAARAEAESLSAAGSIDLEDIIGEYDEPSVLSRSTLTKKTRSYFSLSNGNNNNTNDDTTSFYSALHDGFSLNDQDLDFDGNDFNSSNNRNKYKQESFWCNRNNNKRNNGGTRTDECDIMLQPTHFQISWYDLNFTIKPRATIWTIWDEGKQRVFHSIESASRLFNSCKSTSSAASYDINSKDRDQQETVTILRNVNGSFKSGELTAVMGPSGAGKTSLLNILSRRRETGFTGQVHVSESQSNHRIRINAIPQHDNLKECLTVRKNLTFASRLKNSNSNSIHEKKVCRVSNQLGLDECLDTRVKNLSGGQLKRLAIAQELLSQPDILILDEPTSGLDSATCLKTLSVLKTLVVASRKKEIDPIAIVLTIHQPQQEAFNLFDKVYVMANGGIVIYHGSPYQCTDFIEKYSGLKMPSLDYNPATFLVEIASGEYGQEPIEALAQQVRLEYAKLRQQPNESPMDKRKTSSYSIDMLERASSIVSLTRESNVKRPASSSDHQVNNTKNPNQQQQQELYLDSRLAKSSSVESGRFCSKTSILTERCWLSMWRDPKQLAGRILFFILLPFGLAFLMGTDPGKSNGCPKYRPEYSLKGIMQNDDYLSKDVQEEFLLAFENTGLMFIMIYSAISANIAAMTLNFTLDMKSCLKEYYNGWYSMNSYVFARVLSNLPMDLAMPTLTMALTYYATGQNTGTTSNVTDVYRVVITSLALIIGSCIGEIIGMFFGLVYMDNITTALFASQGATLPFVLLSGFVTRTKNMNRFVQILTQTSLYKHCLDVAFVARYGWSVCDCDPKQFDNNPEVQLTGVSEELRNFVKYWMQSQEDQKEATTVGIVNATNSAILNQEDDSDMFQVIARQISLYNTYGIQVTSCEQIKPYALHDQGLSERDLLVSFASLICIFLFMTIVLLILVKLVTRYRTSL